MGDVPQPQPEPQAPHCIGTDVDGRSARIMATFRDSLLSKLAESNPSISINSDYGLLIDRRVQQIFKSFRTPTHPPYALMIQRAVTELDEEIGSSEEAISDFIQGEYNDLPWAHVRILGLHLRKLCVNGELVCTETGRYKLLADDVNFGAGEKMSGKENKKLKRGTKTKMHRDIKGSMKVGSEGTNRENGLGKENEEQIRVSELQVNRNNELSRMLEKQDEQITEQSEAHVQSIEISKEQSNSGKGLLGKNEQQIQSQLQRIEVTEEMSGKEKKKLKRSPKTKEHRDEVTEEMSRKEKKKLKRGTKTKMHRDITGSMKMRSKGINRDNGLGKYNEEQIQVSELQVNGNNDQSRMPEKQHEQITDQSEAHVQWIEISKEQNNSRKGLLGKTEQQNQSQLQGIEVTEECDEVEGNHGKVFETYNVAERLQIGSTEGHIQKNNVDSNGQSKKKAEGYLLTEIWGQDGKEHHLAVERQNLVDDALNESLGQETKVVPQQDMEQLQTRERARSLVSFPNPEPTEAIYSSQPTAPDLPANLTSSSQCQLTVPILEEYPHTIPSAGKELLPTIQAQLRVPGNGPPETGLGATSKTSASMSFMNVHEHKQPQIWNQGSTTPKLQEDLTVRDPVQRPRKRRRGRLTEPKPAAEFREELLPPVDDGILNGQPQGQNTGQGRPPKLAQNAQLEQRLRPQSRAKRPANFQNLEPNEKRSEEHNKLQLEAQSQIMRKQCVLGLSADENIRRQKLNPKASKFGPDMPLIAITSAEHRQWQQSQTFEGQGWTWESGPGQQSQTFNGQDWTWEIVPGSVSSSGSGRVRGRGRGRGRGRDRGQGRGRGRPPKLMFSVEQGHLSQPCQSQLLGRPLEQNPEINQSQQQPQSQPCQSQFMESPLEQNPEMNPNQLQLQSQPCQGRLLGRPPNPKPELNQSQQQLQSQPIQIRRSERPRKKPEMVDQNLQHLPSQTNQVQHLRRIPKREADIDRSEQQLPSEHVKVRRLGRPPKRQPEMDHGEQKPPKRKPEMDQSEPHLSRDPYEFVF